MERTGNRKRPGLRSGRSRGRRSERFLKMMRWTSEPRKRSATRTRKRSADANSSRSRLAQDGRRIRMANPKRSSARWGWMTIPASGSRRRTGLVRNSGKNRPESSTRSGRCGHRVNRSLGYIPARRRTADCRRRSGVKRNRSGWPEGKKRRPGSCGRWYRSLSAAANLRSKRPNLFATAR